MMLANLTELNFTFGLFWGLGGAQFRHKEYVVLICCPVDQHYR